MDKGWSHYKTGDCQRAIADYDQALALDPQCARAYGNRGIAHRVLGDLPAAIADYDRAIALNPEFASAFYNKPVP